MIATNPDGAFSGVLTDVTAGSWYAVEVRTVTDATAHLNSHNGG